MMTLLSVLGVAGRVVLHDDTFTGVLEVAGRVVLHDDTSIRVLGVAGRMILHDTDTSIRDLGVAGGWQYMVLTLSGIIPNFNTSNYIHLMCIDCVINYSPAYSSCIQWQANEPIAGTTDC
jgi:hypothetical protein